MFNMCYRLAIVISHPTQYYSPWFRHLANYAELRIKVFYLWESGTKESLDRNFGTSFVWDIPLLEGYEHQFLENQSSSPGTHCFRGLDNPGAAEALRSWNPDVVLMFGYNYITHLRLIFSPALRKIPFFFRGDSHDLYRLESWKQSLSKQARSLLFRRFDKFLAVGSANAAYFRNQRVPEDKIIHVPHCVDNNRFRMAAPAAIKAAERWKVELGIPSRTAVVLFAGKFEEKKRPLDLLHAFLAMKDPSVSETDPESVLLFVGNGALERQLLEKAGSAIGVRVFFAPFQNQSEMPKVYAAGDVLVLPSFGNGETWGLAVNEAMNLAKPVIVSSHVGCAADLVIPGQTGWVFPAGDQEALRSSLEKAMSDPTRLREMGCRAREHVDGFSYDAAASALIEALPGKIDKSIQHNLQQTV